MHARYYTLSLLKVNEDKEILIIGTSRKQHEIFTHPIFFS